MVKRPKKTAAKRAARKPAAPKQGRARITEQMVLDSMRRPMVMASAPMIPAADIFKPYQHPKSVYGDQHKAPTMAMDDAGSYGAQAWATNNPGLVMHEGLAFFGYSILAEMTQRPEYRRISEVIATEMTREWITLKSKGEADKSEMIGELNDDIAKFGIKALFKEAAEQDGFFGRSHIFPDFGISEKQNGELKTPITDADGKLAPSKIKKGTLRKLKCIEPVWIAPMNYNTTNPLADDWYKPTTWLVQGIEVHHTRLVTFIGREVPDILKPAYSFGGLPMSQIAKPYVDNWLQTRSNVNQLIGNFSIVVFGTNLLHQSGFGGSDGSAASDLGNRMQMFANYRRNNGAALIDKDTEEMQSLAVPLGTLDALQAQSQEQMCSVTGIPVVKLLGIQPAGLNASSAGEITSFYDSIKAYQQALFAGNLTYILQILMMNRYGKVDEDIIFEFNSLERATPHEMAEMRRLDAETGAILIDSNVITAKEERARLQADPTGVYTNLEEDTPQEVMGDLDKANSAANLTAAVMSVHESNLISDKQALTELAAMSKTTGLWTSITPEDIEAADDEPPEPAESLATLPGAPPAPINGRGGQPPGKTGRAAAPQAPAPRAQQ